MNEKKLVTIDQASTILGISRRQTIRKMKQEKWEKVKKPKDRKTYVKKCDITKKCHTKKIGFPWYGGKLSHLHWLLPLLPNDEKHYIEPYGGSMAVLLNKEPSQSETYNDLDSNVVNFFRVLRKYPQELQRVLSLTPYSREEYENCLDINSRAKLGIHKNNRDLEIELARKFFVRCRMTILGLAQSASKGRWQHIIKSKPCISKWWNSIEGLNIIAARIMEIQIENLPAINIIKKYDFEGALFYLDPPYIHESRKPSCRNEYFREMTNEDHLELAKVLKKIKGRFAISGYRCPTMDKIYKDFYRVDAPEKICNSGKSKRTESLWSNYNTQTLKGQRVFWK